MQRTKPLSMEEKANRLEELLHQYDTFYRMQDLEKLAPQQKGIISTSVKDVIELLVSEGRAKEEKTGGRRLIWSFPSDKKIHVVQQKSHLQEELIATQPKIQAFQAKISELQAQRNDTPTRQANISTYQHHQQQIVQLDRQLSIYQANDPTRIASLKEEIQAITQEINIHTENIFTLRAYLISNFNAEPATIDKSFNIPADLDTI
ncbi:hypothetical protein NEHOM01_0834 [Nematocida homosporus]|uniref:uncharacterized protein n=1 Tax=Nematocida homosporus TaxID=1912981 RepID=UPI0022203F5E|nr:uncharacterized protein NEHOM01_0834 [Nematocida homosporus]KAI5185419.1 hypothetical protein NEHOM01_0834 [Nematocida homosporus]